MHRVKQAGIVLTLITLMFTFACAAEDAGPALASPPDNAIWIDVRTAEEYAEGHVDQAGNIPYDVIVPGVAGMNLAKDAPIYLYCRSGHRAGLAKEALEAQHYTRVINVGGLEDAQALLAREAH